MNQFSSRTRQYYITRSLLVVSAAIVLFVLQFRSSWSFLTLSEPLQFTQKLSAPIKVKFERVKRFFSSQQSLIEQLEFLKEENLLLTIQAENYAILEQNYKQLLDLHTAHYEHIPTSLVTKLIRLNAKSFGEKILLPVGQKAGLSKGDIFVGKKGVLGIVKETEPNYSWAVFLTSRSAVIPAEHIKTGHRCLVRGTGKGAVELLHVQPTVDIEIGDQIVTSGLGGQIQRGLLIGQVTSISGDKGTGFQHIQVELAADIEGSEQILLFMAPKLGVQDAS